MPLMRAMRPWLNREHEGQVAVGQEFEATEYRARELIMLGLAAYAVSEHQRIKVEADPPPAEDSPGLETTHSPPHPRPRRKR